MKITLLKSFLLLGAFLCFGMIKAQTVSGTVSDANGPLPGASVLVKGTTNGTQTDFDGNYTLNGIDGTATLVFSYIGFKTVEIAVNGQSTINVTLEEDAQALDEVVIIGYGQTTVKDATGAVAVVTSEDFNQGVIASPEQLIQGKTAGVQITQSSGEPGAGINVRIRGTSSVRSNNNPLFVVDGMPLSGESTSADGADVGTGSSSAKNPLNFLNPNDIESISILKDASATAIYGSRGANGVVIITTKSGKTGKGQFEFTSNLSYSTPAKRFNLLNRNEFLTALPNYGGDPNALDYGYDTDWQELILRSTASQNQNLSYSKNYGSGNVRASFGYGKQFGVVEGYAQERLTGRINASQRFLEDKLKLDATLTVSRINDDGGAISNNSGSTGDLIGAAYFANPTWPARTTFTTGGSEINPLQLLNYYDDVTHTDRFLGNVSAEYSITPELKGKVAVGYDKSTSEKYQVQSGLSTGIGDAPGQGQGAFGQVDVTGKLLDVTLTYNKEFENSKLTALVGYSFQSYQRAGKNITALGFGSNDLNQMISDLGTATSTIESQLSGSYQQFGYNSSGTFVNRLFPTVSQNESVTSPGGVPISAVAGNYFDYTDELQSFFGRAEYTIADKYILTGTLRVDGSSRFGPNNQYGYFPSGAFAWKLNEEDFIGDAFSTLKLRLGYGITGNQEGLGYGNFTVRQRFAGISIDQNQNINAPGLEILSFTNDDLKWEETNQANIGIDFGFANDRFTGSVDVYHKVTNDLLLQQEAAQPSPQAFYFGNLDAKVINKGVEVSMNYDIIQTEDATWNLGVNGAYNDNMVKDFDGLIQTGEINGNGLTGAYAQLLAGGQPLFSYYLREFGGFDENGISLYPNGDVQEFVGKSALPKVTLGINTSVSYKNWDFNAFLTGQYGFYVYNNTQNAYFTAGIIGVGKNITKDVLTNGESNANAADVSTRFLEKGDFLRLQNASLSYNVPLSGQGALKSLRLSMIGQNLFIITDYSGLDPEVNVPKSLNNIPSLGIDYTAFPRARTVTLGISATF
ncbi:SusC/RagA family TonB-linked outer membrane protein [Flagellimonas aequoris]|uniref:SusC/RagA family TonB-linked outer membrane protein n=1 Tax=Flagellimonas aequoris TaxID=2306997 RepID=A0A418N7P6_9FLAO|nr:SusC/RagA family TonB-linked outer membrane protein [Allomuricauda aequoris]RIV70637.1 SusC/RagA family TonB-linked outer membrane protein [Allomuricauda aequoris]TXK02072.1 SusC/RagA family TonB-linked outer membrane protein [Allomuricauda aequoris]